MRSLALQADTLGSIADSLSAQEANLTEVNSTISDTDMAQAATSFSQNQIQNNVSITMLAQANLMGKQVLKLLQG